MSRRYRYLPLVPMLAMGLFALNSAISVASAAELSLDESIVMALKNNPAIQMALADEEKAKWGIKENEGGRLPTLSLSNSSNRSLNVAGAEPNDSFSTSLRLNWSLYTGGRVEGQINQAKSNAHIASLGVVKAQEQVKLDTATAYFNVLQSRNLVAVNQQTVDSLAEHFKNVQAQYEVGIIAKSDVLRSDVELANAQQNLTKAQNTYDLAVANFNNVTGMPLELQHVMKEELAHVKYEMSLEDSIKMALEKRPEIAQSQDTIDIAKTGIAIADSGRLPTVAVSAVDGLSGSEFPGKNNNWSIGVSANWNLFDAGVTNAKVKSAKASVDKAEFGDAQLRSGIELEVRQAYLSMKEAEARIETAQVAISKGEEDLKASQAKYYAGVGTNLDVIDAQMALTQANTNGTQAYYDYNVSKAKLKKAVGLDVE